MSRDSLSWLKPLPRHPNGSWRRRSLRCTRVDGPILVVSTWHVDLDRYVPLAAAGTVCPRQRRKCARVVGRMMVVTVAATTACESTHEVARARFLLGLGQLGLDRRWDILYRLWRRFVVEEEFGQALLSLCRSSRLGKNLIILFITKVNSIGIANSTGLSLRNRHRILLVEG